MISALKPLAQNPTYLSIVPPAIPFSKTDDELFTIPEVFFLSGPEEYERVLFLIEEPPKVFGQLQNLRLPWCHRMSLGIGPDRGIPEVLAALFVGPIPKLVRV